MSNVPKVERSTVVKSATTGSTLTVEHAVREIEAAPSGKIGAPEVGRVARLVRQHTLLEALVPVLGTRGEVDTPGVVIERNDTRRAAPFGKERVVAVPGADIEHRTTPEVGKLSLGDHLGHHRLALGDDAVPEVDRVVPGERISLRLEHVRPDRSTALIRSGHEHALQALEALEAAPSTEHDTLERGIHEMHRKIGLGADPVAETRAGASRRPRGARR